MQKFFWEVLSAPAESDRFVTWYAFDHILGRSFFLHGDASMSELLDHPVALACGGSAEYLAKPCLQTRKLMADWCWLDVFSSLQKTTLRSRSVCNHSNRCQSHFAAPPHALVCCQKITTGWQPSCISPLALQILQVACITCADCQSSIYQLPSSWQHLWIFPQPLSACRCLSWLSQVPSLEHFMQCALPDAHMR